MCGKEEEPVVLQQFLRFGETRPVAQQLLLQEYAAAAAAAAAAASAPTGTVSGEDPRLRAQAEIKRLIERNAAAAAMAAAAACQQQQQQ